MKKETLTEFIYRAVPLSSCDDEIHGLLEDISSATGLIQAAISGASLTGLTGDTGIVNIQGENVQYLDAFADEQIAAVLRAGKHCAGIVSEEREAILTFGGEICSRSRYVVMFDPLDGSSNIDTGLPVGTIFGIYPRKTRPGTAPDLSDFLQPGNRQIAAGYCLYGCTTTFVFATRREANGFTFNPATGEFLLSHPHLQCPENGCIYSVNQGYFHHYDRQVQRYINACGQPPEEKGTGTQRYTGSMAADVHRTLLKGGIFMYPPTRYRLKGKLRLQYECNPLAFVMEAAGGRATNGRGRILDIEPAGLHEVTPVYIGSRQMMKTLMQGFGCDLPQVQ